MFYLVRIVLKTFLALFPKGKHRKRAIGLAAIATIVPLSQLFVIRIFSNLILEGRSQPIEKLVVDFVLFLSLFGVSHLATYWQKTYRVKVFNDALSSRPGTRSKVSESWDWALTFETNNLLHTFTQILVLGSFFIVVSWQSGTVNVVLVLATMLIIKYMFIKQTATQEAFALAQRNNEPVTAFAKVASRIRSAELGTLVANAAFVISLTSLLLFSFQGTLAPADAVMLFLGFRMQNSNLGQTSGSLMRFARAKTLSENANKGKPVKNPDEDELG
jgi:hypothetical protein